PTLDERDVADRVEAIIATFRGLLSDAVHSPDLDRDAVARITRLVIHAVLADQPADL
ncbi:MAG: hypothetical protein JO259_00335, partial [Mycobacterium sp.]|nr:hypothetical protein [Mycobacterium sp.]